SGGARRPLLLRPGISARAAPKGQVRLRKGLCVSLDRPSADVPDLGVEPEKQRAEPAPMAWREPRELAHHKLAVYSRARGRRRLPTKRRSRMRRALAVLAVALGGASNRSAKDPVANPDTGRRAAPPEPAPAESPASSASP